MKREVSESLSRQVVLELAEGVMSDFGDRNSFPMGPISVNMNRLENGDRKRLGALIDGVFQVRDFQRVTTPVKRGGLDAHVREALW